MVEVGPAHQGIGTEVIGKVLKEKVDDDADKGYKEDGLEGPPTRASRGKPCGGGNHGSKADATAGPAMLVVVIVFFTQLDVAHEVAAHFPHGGIPIFFLFFFFFFWLYKIKQKIIIMVGWKVEQNRNKTNCNQEEEGIIDRSISHSARGKRCDVAKKVVDKSKETLEVLYLGRLSKSVPNM